MQDVMQAIALMAAGTRMTENFCRQKKFSMSLELTMLATRTAEMYARSAKLCLSVLPT